MILIFLLVTASTEIVATADGLTCHERIKTFFKKPVAAAAVLLHRTRLLCGILRLLWSLSPVRLYSLRPRLEPIVWLLRSRALSSKTHKEKRSRDRSSPNISRRRSFTRLRRLIRRSIQSCAAPRQSRRNAHTRARA